jgi:hypothetical protein
MVVTPDFIRATPLDWIYPWEGLKPRKPFAANRSLKNYLRWQYCVENGLKMLIYNT